MRSNSGGGGGGGGNRQPGPVSRAQAPGRDSITLPVAKPIAPAPQPQEEAIPVQIVTLDAKPLASDTMFQVGLLKGPIRFSPSQGPGSGGGAGDGVGTGIGSGRGPGVGPGSGGGTGGGVFRPGDGATSPTVVLEVRPSYSPEAMCLKIQGFVQLEAVVQRDGTPRDIRVIRSLDPGGLRAVRPYSPSNNGDSNRACTAASPSTCSSPSRWTSASTDDSIRILVWSKNACLRSDTLVRHRSKSHSNAASRSVFAPQTGRDRPRVALFLAGTPYE